jgi:hypothetical protein
VNGKQSALVNSVVAFPSIEDDRVRCDNQSSGPPLLRVESPLSPVPVLVALEQVRRLRGGSQAQVLRCDDESHYVVKFQNNPQGVRILASELLAARIARFVGLPVPQPAIVFVDEQLIEHTEDLVIQLRQGHTKCKAGLQFGSRYSGSPVQGVVWDFLPDDQFCRIANIEAFLGMLAFDKWTSNTDGRQTVFVQSLPNRPFQVLMIDNGWCFSGASWTFLDAPLRGLYARSRVYENVHGIESFEPWLTRIELMDEDILRVIAREIPNEWLDADSEGFDRMVDRLWRRRNSVRGLIASAVNASPGVFPNWHHPFSRVTASGPQCRGQGFTVKGGSAVAPNRPVRKWRDRTELAGR